MQTGSGVSTRIQAVQSNTDPVLIIGNFDGVHTGHRAVIEAAGAHGPVVAVTFTPHPLQLLRPDKAPRLLTSTERRRELLLACGVADVVEIPFTREVSQWSPAEFVERALLPLRPCRVVVGTNFRFGHRAAGTPDTLVELADGRFDVEVLPLRQGVSSTRIREAVASGDVVAANRMLGRPFRYSEAVVEGHRRGHELGFPTANLPVDPSRVAPADGVYAGWLTRLDEPDAVPMPAAISVGTNPTFDDVLATVVEGHVLDRTDLELYGVPVAVDFIDRLRGNVRFDGLDALIAQMTTDVADVRRRLSSAD